MFLFKNFKNRNYGELFLIEDTSYNRSLFTKTKKDKKQSLLCIKTRTENHILKKKEKIITKPVFKEILSHIFIKYEYIDGSIRFSKRDLKYKKIIIITENNNLDSYFLEVMMILFDITLLDLVRQNFIFTCHLPFLPNKDLLYNKIFNKRTRSLISIVENDIKSLSDIREKANNKRFLSRLYGAMI